MSETKHTPGPFRYERTYMNGSGRVVDGQGRSVASIPATSKRSEAEKMANGALLAAAPGLLAALKKTVAALAEFDVEEDRATIALALAEIAKAEAR